MALYEAAYEKFHPNNIDMPEMTKTLNASYFLSTVLDVNKGNPRKLELGADELVVYHSSGYTSISMDDLASLSTMNERFEALEEKVKLLTTRNSQLREKNEELNNLYDQYKKLERQVKVLEVLGEE